MNRRNRRRAGGFTADAGGLGARAGGVAAGVLAATAGAATACAAPVAAGKAASGASGKAAAAPVNAKADAWSPRALAGPVASIEEWCRRQPKAEPCLGLDEASRARATLPAPVAPLLGGRWVVTGNAEEKTARLALQTAAGWFVSPLAGAPGLFVRPVEVVTRAGAPPLVMARVVTTWNAAGDAEGNGRWQLRCQESLLVCGVGPSGTPSCTSPIPARDGACEDPDQPIDWSYSLDVSVRPDGQLLIAAPAGGAKLTADALSALGKHPLRLP